MRIALDAGRDRQPVQLVLNRSDPLVHRSTRPPDPDPVVEAKVDLQRFFPARRFRVNPIIHGVSVHWIDGPTRLQVAEILCHVRSCWRWNLHRSLSPDVHALQLLRYQGALGTPEYQHSDSEQWLDIPAVDDPTRLERQMASILLGHARSTRTDGRLSRTLDLIGRDELLVAAQERLTNQG